MPAFVFFCGLPTGKQRGDVRRIFSIFLSVFGEEGSGGSGYWGEGIERNGKRREEKRGLCCDVKSCDMD